MRLVRVTILLIGLAAPVLLTAHDAKLHKGKATEGEIVAVSADRFELKTAAGSKTVLLDAKTKIEKGSQAAAASDLKKGDRVSVFGTTLASGELVSREIVIGKAGNTEAHGGHGTAHKAATK